jgi:hypothetical protein
MTVGDIRGLIVKLFEEKASEFASNNTKINNNNNNNNNKDDLVVDKVDSDLSSVIPSQWLNYDNFVLYLAEEPCTNNITIQGNHFELTISSTEKQVLFYFLFFSLYYNYVFLIYYVIV